MEQKDNERIGKLENRVGQIEGILNKDLAEIKTALAVITNQTSNFDTQDNLRNQIIEEKVKNQSDRIKKLEENQRWFILLILGLVVNAVWKLLI